jgi:uncharacterized protein YgbK (DUF1537 family)
VIVVIADDFSGAAELAGLAASRGWNAEVQTSFDANSDADVIAFERRNGGDGTEHINK